MSQSRKSSFAEALVNTVIGYAISVATYAFVMPLLGYETTLRENVTLVAVFSIISIVRNYVIRRWFARRAPEVTA